MLSKGREWGVCGEKLGVGGRITPSLRVITEMLTKQVSVGMGEIGGGWEDHKAEMLTKRLTGRKGRGLFPLQA